jgi:hypothetical protein
MLNPIMIARGSFGGGGLERTTLGRLYAQATSSIVEPGVEDSFNTSDWTPRSTSPPVQIEGVNGYLRFIAAGASPGTATVYINTIADRATAMMFGRLVAWGRTNVLTLPMFRGDVPGGVFPSQAIYGVARNSTLDSLNLIERSASATVQSDLTALAIAANNTIGLRAKGSDANLWTSAAPANRTLASVVMQTAGKVGFGTQNFSGFTTSIYADYNRIAVHADDFLRVTASIGIRARILDAGDNVLASVDAAGGTADINLWDIRATYCPDGLPLAVKLQVYDLATLSLQAEATPPERLWGGDVWNLP